MCPSAARPARGGVCVPALPDVNVVGARGAPFWTTTGLGACAMLVDGATSRDDIARGVATGLPTAALRLVLSGDTLVIEVSDDVFVTRARRPTRSTSGTRARSSVRARSTSDCAWTALPSIESGRALTVEMTAAPGVRRFAMPDTRRLLDAEWEAAYDDVDDGRTSRGTLSTGKGDLAPPVFTSPVPCEASSGTLTPAQRTPKDSLTAVAP